MKVYTKIKEISYPNPDEHYSVYYRASNRPWDGSLGMVRVSPHSWYVGTDWVGVILIETGDGLIMIDSGIKGQMWMIFESVRKLGYDPQKDIKLCLLSHAHADHISGAALLKAYCNPVIYINELEKDWPSTPERFSHIPRAVDLVIPFEADRFYDYNRTIKLGSIEVYPLHTPGHTPGTTSFFFDDCDDDGTVYRVGLHGGLGTNTVEDIFFDNAEDAKEARSAFRDNQKSLLDIPVDITITNHGVHLNMHRRVAPYSTDFRPFIDCTAWRNHIEAALERLDDIEAASCFK